MSATTPSTAQNQPPNAAWQFTSSSEARAAGNGLPGRIDLLRPNQGVTIDLNATNGSNVNILGLAIETPVGRETLADAYERVTDLVATYLPTADRPHRVQVYWQRPVESLPGVRAWFDMQVLTQTDLLDSDPRRSTLSELPIGEVLRLSVASEQLVVLKPTASLKRDASLPCLVVRPDGTDWSYLEMVHPLDFHQSDLQVAGNRLQIRQALFVAFLEKGVILRSRVRGAIVDRTGDTKTARELYRRLCEESPPLAT
jgi:hypothetical protein